MRTVNKIRCEICKSSYSSVGMASHLYTNHKMTNDEYATKYFEFRKKLIESNSRIKNIECKICKTNVHSERALSFHLNVIHKIKRVNYSKKYTFNNKIPLCKCGCGKEINLMNKYPYYREYISGHNPNPMTGKHHSIKAKTKMSDAAVLRLNKLKSSGIKAPMHYRKYIFERVYGDFRKYTDSLLERNIEFLSTIEDINTDMVKLKFKCLSCNSNYEQNSLDMVCRKCIKTSSLEQIEVETYIENVLQFTILKNERKILSNGYELDIYIPSIKVAIEYNGLYWHSELNGKDKNYHLNKTKECEKVGIQLIHIFEDEWINKKDIIKSKLKHILLKNVNKKVYARECDIKEISNELKKKFLEEFHIQGTDKSKVKLGAFYKDELVAVMTFTNLRVSLGNKVSLSSEYELIRFSTNYNYSVIGIAGKLLKYFVSKYSPSKIISYADKRWSINKVNNLYNSIGFTFIKNTQPNYWYTYKYKERLHRFNFTKSNLIKLGADKLLSEWTIMKSMGYDRIWDCGNLKYELVVK